jgi:hypothetical protein
LDRIVFEVLLESHADLSKVISLSCNFLRLNVIELSFDPDLLKLLPLFE